ncbi:MAG: hypothetical protein E7568_07080 [Ruminococcaceae bacterium]|nr:hypothetical protein [Oscillospiraceae bacterium]
MTEKINTTPSVFLITVFILGNSVINLPFTKYGGNALLGYILSVLIGIVYIFFCYRAAKINKDSNSYFYKVFLGFFIIYCIFCGLICTRNFITFSDKVILPEVSSFLPSLLFLISLYFLSSVKKEVIIKTALISGLIITVILLLLFIISISNMKFSNIIIKDEISLGKILYECSSYFGLSFSQSIILMPFFMNTNLKTPKNTYIKGFLLGSFLLLVSFLQCILIFGYNLASTLLNPYASAISITTLGNSYTRLEGFSYFIYFASSLIKTAICLRVSVDLSEKINSKIKNIILPVSLIIYAVFCALTDTLKNIEYIKIMPFLIIPPLIILTVLNIKKKI